MKRSYLDYAMSVIVARAIPDVRDGLKACAACRILVAMNDLGLASNRGFPQVRENLRRHFRQLSTPARRSRNLSDHGSPGAAMANMRYMLVDGQGNFGSVDGDPPAASVRYTEARLSRVAEELLADLEKETVDFVPNFDQTRDEPSILPAKNSEPSGQWSFRASPSAWPPTFLRTT